MDWDDLRLFQAVAAEGSTLAAARKLGLDQTTVSRRLARLEAALGLRLFDRQQSGFRLTDQGRALVPLVADAGAAMAAIDHRAALERRALGGVIRLTSTETLLTTLLAPWLREFADAHPDIRVEAIAAENRLDLAAGEADVAIRAVKQPDEPGVVVRRLARSPWGVFAGASYIARHGAPKSVADLADHAVIGFSGNAPRNDITAWWAENVPAASIRAGCNSIAAMIGLVRAGQGVGILPIGIPGPDEMIKPCFPLPDFGYHYFLVTNAGLKDVPRTRLLADFMAARMRAARRRLEVMPPAR